jgi:hypothetical protein
MAALVAVLAAFMLGGSAVMSSGFEPPRVGGHCACRHRDDRAVEFGSA